MRRGRRSERGVTYIEMVATAGILLIMASAILPTAKTAHRKKKEIELQAALREIRSALDEHRARCFNPGGVQATVMPYDNITIDCQQGLYPKTLEVLVEGVRPFNPNVTNLQAQDFGEKAQTVKLLRRIPLDPITNSYDWGLRSRKDAPDSTSWGGDEIWDVYCKSTQMSLDGKRRYNEF